MVTLGQHQIDTCSSAVSSQYGVSGGVVYIGDMHTFSTSSEEWSSKVLVVLGGSGLIGRQVVQSLEVLGAQVVNADLTVESRPGSSARTALHETVTTHVDLANERSVDNFSSSLLSTFGAIDGVINASYVREAGQGSSGSGTTAPYGAYERFRSAVERHLGSCYLVSQIFGESMRDNPNGGSIVHLSSIYGSHAPRFGLYAGTSMEMPAWYAAAKGGVNALMRYFAASYLDFGVRVNCVAPGGVRDGQPEQFQGSYDSMCGPVGLLHPNDVAGVAIFLVSDLGRAITGQVITVDDGWSL